MHPFIDQRGKCDHNKMTLVAEVSKMRMKDGPIKFNKDTTNIILDSISDGVFTVDHDWKITYFNRAAEKITRTPLKEAVGRYCWEVFRSNMCEKKCALKRTIDEKKPFVSSSAFIIRSDQKRIPISASTSLLIDEKGNALGGVEVFRDLSMEEALRSQITARFHLEDMVSQSAAMQDIFNILPQIAESDSTVLISGKTGTGKELMAKAVHNLSHRKDKPFIAINCGALPDTLLESELFGHKAGAFTSAVKDKPGHFSLAEGGSIFLDEIESISPAFQVRLLRVLNENEFMPLGGVKKEKSDVRIIAASKKDLNDMVASGEFRQDLFYRINVVEIKLPPLKDRIEDIPLLVKHFISKFNRLKNKSIQGVDQVVMTALMTYDYPGNIRELENIIEHGFVLCRQANIHPGHLPPNLFSEAAKVNPTGKTETVTHQNPVKAAKIKLIMDTLKKNDFSRQAAAAEMGIHKSTLFRQIKKLGIVLPRK